MYKILRICFYVVLTVLFSCSAGKTMNREEFLAWYNSPANPVIKTKTAGGVTMDVKYKNVDYYIASNTAMTTDEISKIRAENDFLDFDVRLQSTESSIHITDLLQRNMQGNQAIDLGSLLAFGLKDYARIYTKTDTLKCAVFHQIRNYDLAPYLDFSVEFPFKGSAEALEQGFTLSIDLTDLNQGIQKFEYSKEDLNSIPHLQL